MKRSPSSSITRWMLSPLEVIGIVGLIALTVGGVYYSIRDAVQLQNTLDLSLTQTVILNQGVVNLQRETLLMEREVLRLLGNLDTPAKEITRFDFIKIQVNNLSAQVETPEIKYIYNTEDLNLVHDIQDQTKELEHLLVDYETKNTQEQKVLTLQLMNDHLVTMEGLIKQLIDNQSTTQRNAIIQTRDSLSVSQRTDFIAGGVLILMGVMLAIAVRRVLTTRLQRALEADEIKSQLLRTVSHELRTPIAAINGYSNLLLEDSYGAISQEQKRVMQRILVNTNQLQGMVNNLLDRAQIEQGRLTIKNTVFPANELITTTQSALEVLATSKGIQLTGEISSDMPETLYADKIRLQQILFNLTSNALKFTEHGSVHIRLFKGDASHWALQVKDTGIGIPADAQGHIFESFWQVDSSATRQYRGTGLGLSIVKELTELMHGTIQVQSELEKGSTFTATFPLEANPS